MRWSAELILVPFLNFRGVVVGSPCRSSPLPAAPTRSPAPPHPTRLGQPCFCGGVRLDTIAPCLSPPCAQGLPSGWLPKMGHLRTGCEAMAGNFLETSVSIQAAAADSLPPPPELSPFALPSHP